MPILDECPLCKSKIKEYKSILVCIVEYQICEKCYDQLEFKPRKIDDFNHILFEDNKLLENSDLDTSIKLITTFKYQLLNYFKTFGIEIYSFDSENKLRIVTTIKIESIFNKLYDKFMKQLIFCNCYNDYQKYKLLISKNNRKHDKNFIIIQLNNFDKNDKIVVN